MCYNVSSRVNANFYEIKDFTLINILLKLASEVSIFFIIQIEKLFRIIFSMYSILSISILSLACRMKNTNISTFFLGTQINYLIY